MSDSAVLPLLAYVGWSFLPNVGTSIVQSVYYKLTIPVGQVVPQAGTRQYARDHRRIRIFVLSSYLIYTLLQSLYDIKLAGDFFTLLAVSPYTSSEKEIRSRFRRLAARYHPDKIGAGTGSQEEQYFLQLRLAAETLTTPPHRYLYTHFGPSILTHLPKPDGDGTTGQDKNFTTATMIPMALRARAPSYLFNLGFVVVLNTFLLRGASSHGKFWRYFIIAASFTLEFYLLTHEVPSLELPLFLSVMLSGLTRLTGLSNLLPPHLLPYQILQISAQLVISLNIFISQISGLFPSMSLPTDGTMNSSQLGQYLSSLNSVLSQINANTTRVDAEATSLLDLQFAPYRGQPRYVAELRKGMKDGMITGTIRQHPEIQQALRNAVQRRRAQGGGRFAERASSGSVGGVQPVDGGGVVDLLNSDEQFI